MTHSHNINPTIILTGGLGLLGSATAQYLSKHGLHVLVIDIAAECGFESENISYIQFDLTQIEKYDSLVNSVRGKTKNLKGIINNAAFNPKVEDNSISVGKFEDLILSDWRKEVNLNLTAPIFLIQSLLPIFNTSDGENCKIVNVISTYGLVPPNQDVYKGLAEIQGQEIYKPISYPVTKAGLAMATKYLAVYLGERGFNVNGIAPGGIENNQPQVFIDAYAALTPMKRMAKVEEMMETFYLLCTKGSNYINGQIIAVDGGWTSW